MAVWFREVTSASLHEISVSAPDGAVIGIIGENGAGKRALLRLAAGLDQPASGEVRAGGPTRLLGPSDELNFAGARTLLIHHTLARHDALACARAAIQIERLRRGGATVLLVSHDQPLLGRLADEIWWLAQGKLAGQGDPRETLDAYQRHIARRFRDWGATVSATLAPSLRRGDGRACLLRIETLGEQGQPTMVWSSGELATVLVTVRYEQAVPDPVIGIMIRTCIGFEVYGTNTELERIPLGPCAAGDTLCASFRFRCDLCPQEYTLTAASHDPDGVWHDWLEDAIAFSVTDSRYTAGVANLRASASVERL